MTVARWGLLPLTLACSEATAPPEGVGSLADHIAFMASSSTDEHDRGIAIVRTDGTGRALLTSVEAIPTWSPDGSRLAYGVSAGIFVMKGDGSDLIPLTSTPPQFIVYHDPAWSPDGSQVAYTRTGRRPSGPFNETFVSNADGSNQRQIAELGGVPRWSPDGARLAFATPSVDFLAGDESQVYVMASDGTGLVQLTGGPGTRCCVTWSPDGGRLAFFEQPSPVPPGSAEAVLYVMAPDGSSRVSLGSASLSEPRWSPDGSRIAFSRSGGIAVIAPDGTGLASLVQRGSNPDWSPDGTKLAFNAPEVGTYGSRIFIMNADGSGVVPLSPARSGDCCPAWNPQ